MSTVSDYFSSIKGRITGLTVSKSVELDNDGYEDIEKFWSLAEVSKSVPQVSKQSTTTSLASTDDSEIFDYDTSDSITVEEEDNEEDLSISSGPPRVNSILDKPVGPRTRRSSSSLNSSSHSLSLSVSPVNRSSISSALSLEDSFDKNASPITLTPTNITDSTPNSNNLINDSSSVGKNSRVSAVKSTPPKSPIKSPESHKSDTSVTPISPLRDTRRVKSTIVTSPLLTTTTATISVIKPRVPPNELDDGDDNDMMIDMHYDGDDIPNFDDNNDDENDKHEFSDNIHYSPRNTRNSTVHTPKPITSPIISSISKSDTSPFDQLKSISSTHKNKHVTFHNDVTDKKQYKRLKTSTKKQKPEDRLTSPESASDSITEGDPTTTTSSPTTNSPLLSPTLSTTKKTPITNKKSQLSSASASAVTTIKSSSKRRVSTSTPSSSLNTTKLTTISTPGSNDFTRGRILLDESYRTEKPSDNEDDSDDEDEDEDGGITDKSYMTESSFINSLRNNKGDDDSTDGEENAEDGDGKQIRRSKRITKGITFAFWKNERPIYEKGQFKGIIRAEPTPKKSKKRSSRLRKNNKNSNNSTKNINQTSSQAQKIMSSWTDDDDDDDDDEMSNSDDYNGGSGSESRKKKKMTSSSLLLPPPEIPKKLSFKNRDEDTNFSIWKDDTESIDTLSIVCTKDSLYPPSALPITSERPSSNTKVGYAAQYFNMPSIPDISSGCIAGYVELPPGAIKDAEMVGDYIQVFFVGDCQKESVELGIGDPSQSIWIHDKAQRILLTKGDSFYVPPGNLYRLENYSRTQSCMLFWTIIKPLKEIGEDDNMDTSDEVNTMKIQSSVEAVN